ncbi:MAG TPA: HD domain-containing phosphohydrolase [Thermoanaerobaculia bacterium]|nr:HD domain-containing phosphohydrolase [Thermoanaerobaculia bacterium]
MIRVEYEKMLQIGARLAGTLELGRVLETALEEAEQVCQAETSSIWEVDEDARELFFRVVRGRAAGEIKGLRVPLGEGIVGSVALSAAAEVVNDVAADPRWRGDMGGSFRTRALLAVPLIAREKVIGVLQLLNPVGREGFDDEDLRRMELFASFLANPLQNARLHEAQRRQFLETVTVLAEFVERRDPYTGGHFRRVAAYSLLLGAELGLDREALEALELAAILHDIGKIAVPDAILGKPAPLDAAEVAVMQSHPAVGAEIVGRLRSLRHVLPAVRSHHERVDGKGYPDGLKESEIPLPARIIAVADAFDAMTTSRPYRGALSADRAAAEIVDQAGAQFAPEVAAAFRALFDRGEFTVEQGRARIEALSPPIGE